MITKVLEDYLEAILILLFEKEIVRTKDLVNYLNVKNSSVVVAVSRLKKLGFVDHEKYAHITLSEKGLKRASDIYQKHKILSDFFQIALNIDPNRSKKMICEMEHFIEDENIEKLKKLTIFLKNNKDIKDEMLNMEVDHVLPDNDHQEKLLVFAKPSDMLFFSEFNDIGVVKKYNFNLEKGAKLVLKRTSVDGNIFEIYSGGNYYFVEKNDAMQIKLRSKK